MQNKDTTPATAQTSTQRPARERVGLAIYGTDSAEALSAIAAAEAAGVRQVWMTQSTPAPDTLSIFAAAVMRTTSTRLGTAIIPTYPRHPLALAQQALALGDLAPGRLRLGIGPSHRPTIEGVYGIPMTAPLEHLREYVAVLRAALWEGKVDYHGRFYTVKTTLPRTPRTWQERLLTAPSPGCAPSPTCSRGHSRHCVLEQAKPGVRYLRWWPISR